MARLFLAGVGLLFLSDSKQHGEIHLATFSIVCRDPRTGDFGVGVTTQPPGVRRLCPFARAGVGAVATQAQVNVSLGPKGLELMEKGMTPRQALDAALREDPGRNNRQLAMIDAKNPPAAFTGTGCQQFAGHILGKDYSVQGNILVSRRTLEEMARVFEETPGSLAGRILAALEAGRAAGGDKRGHNSCAVIVASKRAEGRLLIDLAEDNDPDPIRRVLEKFLRQCGEYFELGDRELGPGDSGPDVRELEEGLKTLGHFGGEPDRTFDAETAKAFEAFRRRARLARAKVDRPAVLALRRALDEHRRRTGRR